MSVLLSEVMHPAIRRLAESGVLEDMSWGDEVPSVGAPFHAGRGQKLWTRLWMEHSDPARRRLWPDRYTLVVLADPMVIFGRRICATEDFQKALEMILRIVGQHGLRDKLGRFRIGKESFLPF